MRILGGHVNTKALHDYAISIVMDIAFGIRRPLILANNFDIKLVINQIS